MPKQPAALGFLWSKQLQTQSKPRVSQGKYPFMTWVNEYLEAMEGAYSATTIEDRRRMYLRMNEDLRKMNGRGEISSTNPSMTTMEDVGRIIRFYRNKKWKRTSIERVFSALGNLLNYVGNPVYTMYKLRHPSMFVSCPDQRLSPLDTKLVARIIERSYHIDDADWNTHRAYALVLFAIGTGARTKEIRLAALNDLNLNEGVFYTEHVKGEGSWGHPRVIPIRPEIVPILVRYLELRERHLARLENVSTALFPSLYGISEGHLSSNSLRKIKSIVEKDIGDRFDFRTCRRTYGQMLIDDGASIETVSVTMGHATTRTTENYYCRRKQKAAIEDAKRIWKLNGYAKS